MQPFPADIDPVAVAMFVIVGLVFLLVYPFARGLLLYWTLKLVKFHTATYWKSFFCVLIGVGAGLATQIVMSGLTANQIQMNLQDPLKIAKLGYLIFGFLFLATLLAEGISILLFFKESVGKTAGAIALFYVFCLMAGVVLFVLLLVAFGVIGAIAG